MKNKLIVFTLLILSMFLVSCNGKSTEEDMTLSELDSKFEQSYVYEEMMMDYYTYGYQSHFGDVSLNLDLINYYDRIESVSFLVFKGYVDNIVIDGVTYQESEYIYGFMYIEYEDEFDVNPHVFRVQKDIFNISWLMRVTEVTNSFDYSEFVETQKEITFSNIIQSISDNIDEDNDDYVYRYEIYESTYTINELDNYLRSINIVEDDHYGYLIRNNQATVIGFKEGVELEAVVIPEKVNNYNVIGFREYSFITTGFDSVSLPKTIIHLGSTNNSNLKFVKEITIHEDNPYYKTVDHVVYNHSLDKLIMYPAFRQGLNFTVPKEVKTIGQYSMFRAPAFNMTFEENSNLEVIEPFAFYQSQVKNIELPASLKRIEHHAFYNCRYLTELIIPENSLLETIGGNAFRSSSLTTIDIPKNVHSISSTSYANMNLLSAINVDEDNQHYKSIDGVLLSKDTSRLINYPMGKEALSYTVPEGVQYIDDYAFLNSKLETLDFESPADLLSIGQYAFVSSMLKEIEIPMNVNFIGERAFESTRQLEKLSFTEGSVLTFIPEFMLYSSTVKEVYLPENIEVIHQFAFASCKDLEYIGLNNTGKLKEIHEQAFARTDKLTSIFIPNSVTSIEVSAFTQNLELSIYIAEGTDMTDWHEDWYDLVLDINEGVQFYGYTPNFIYALLEDDTITMIKIVVEEDISGLDIPESINGYPVTHIERNAFMSQYTEFYITIPDSVLVIEPGAFIGFNGMFLAEASEKPSGWDDDWNEENRAVQWNYPV